MTYDDNDLTEIETTASGTVRKADAVPWMEELDEATQEELMSAVIPKPYDHSGSTFAEAVSNVRVTGRPEFVAAVASLLKPLLAWESSATRVDLKLQRIEDRDSGELTENYALYLGAAERGVEGKITSALMGTNEENDKRLLEALDD